VERAGGGGVASRVGTAAGQRDGRSRAVGCHRGWRGKNHRRAVADKKRCAGWQGRRWGREPTAAVSGRGFGGHVPHALARRCVSRRSHEERAVVAERTPEPCCASPISWPLPPRAHVQLQNHERASVTGNSIPNPHEPYKSRVVCPPTTVFLHCCDIFSWARVPKI